MNNREIVFSQTIMALSNLKLTIADNRFDKKKAKTKYLCIENLCKNKSDPEVLGLFFIGLRDHSINQFKDNAPIILEPINLSAPEFH